MIPARSMLFTHSAPFPQGKMGHVRGWSWDTCAVTALGEEEGKKSPPVGSPLLLTVHRQSSDELMCVEPKGHMRWSMPRDREHSTFPTSLREMEIQNRIWGQGSEDALQTLLNLDSDIYRDAHDCLSQIPLHLVWPMWYLNRNVTLVTFLSPNPSEPCCSRGWFIHGLCPKWKLLIKTGRKKKKKKSKVGLELAIKWGQVF